MVTINYTNVLKIVKEIRSVVILAKVYVINVKMDAQNVLRELKKLMSFVGTKKLYSVTLNHKLDVHKYARR
jgi:hypothetical protein